MNTKASKIALTVLLIFWVAFCALAWLLPQKDISVAERRHLAKLPQVTMDSITSGTFMSDFESYAVDQFPLRDTFRSMKALFHKNILNQQDNHGIYLSNGYLAEIEYPLDTDSVSRALRQFNLVYERYLKDSGCVIFSSVIPDKSYYLAQEGGYPTMDYERLFSSVRQELSWASNIDLTDTLSLSDYYRTDTHWRQECLIPTAQRIAAAMGITAPQPADYEKKLSPYPFYGVYYGQAALPVEPETLYMLDNAALRACKVYRYQTHDYGPVYDLDRLKGNDLYEVYLSGAQSLLTIENPNARTQRELIVFRDSFASSLVPLLVGDYQKVTLVDIRYISVAQLGKYISFDRQDVLFLYSTLVLNKNLI